MSILEHRHDNQLFDRAIVALLIVGCSLIIGPASLRSVGLIGGTRRDVTALEVALGETLDITAETPESALLGFYPPEDHGAWLGGEIGTFRLSVSDSSEYRSLQLLLLAAGSGTAPNRVVTASASGQTTIVELTAGQPQWVTLDVRAAEQIDVSIQCTPAVVSDGTDVRSLCVLLSAVAVIE